MKRYWGGQSSFTPTKRGGVSEKSFSPAEGGHKQFWGSLIWELEVLAILKGKRNKFPPFKRGGVRKI